MIPTTQATANPYKPTAEDILRGAVARAMTTLRDVARAMGGTGEHACTVAVEGKGEHTVQVDMFVGDTVYEILRDYEHVKRIIIEPVR